MRDNNAAENKISVVNKKCRQSSSRMQRKGKVRSKDDRYMDLKI